MLSPHNKSELITFLPTQTFIEENEQHIRDVIFPALRQDFPDRMISVEETTYSTDEALQLDNGELTVAAREWLWTYAQGTQHGYDRGFGGKIQIARKDVSWMQRLANINCGTYNLVEGGYGPEPADKNIAVIGGFPYLNAERLATALHNDYQNLWEAHSIIQLVGQRRRWNDNPNEATADIVFEQTAHSTGFYLHNAKHQKQLEFLRRASPLLRQEFNKSEGTPWKQSFGSEYEMGRLAIELAILQAEMVTKESLFDWHNYPVTIQLDEQAEEIMYDGDLIPARTERLATYHLRNGQKHFAINAVAVKRERNGEPRHTSDSTVMETYDLLGELLTEKETIIATGAPHIRTGYDAATRLIQLSGGKIATLHLSTSAWEAHEPPVTGIANIVSTDKADKRLRVAVSGNDPDVPWLTAL